MCRRVLSGLISLLMLGSLMVLVPSAGATPLPSAGAATAKPDPFTFSGRRTTPRDGRSRCDLEEIAANPRFGVTGTTTLVFVHVQQGTCGTW